MDENTKKIVASNLTNAVLRHLEVNDGIDLRNDDLRNTTGLAKIMDNIMFVYDTVLADKRIFPHSRA